VHTEAILMHMIFGVEANTIVADAQAVLITNLTQFN